MSPCSAHNGLYQNVPLCGLQRQRRLREGGREGANYSNNNDNIVNLARIIISINLDQEWGMPKINSNDNMYSICTSQYKILSFSFSARNKSTPQTHSHHFIVLGRCLPFTLSPHEVTNHRWRCWQSGDYTDQGAPHCAPPPCPPWPPPPCPPPDSRSPGPGPGCSTGRSRSSRGSSLSSG